MNSRAVFVSDVHLYAGGNAYLGDFVGFLRSVASAAEELFILGDLFDFYVGHRQGRLPFYDSLFGAIRELVEDGTRVHVCRGNRDFLVGRLFRECGATLLPDEHTREFGGFKVHLSHGDQFCIHDRSYQFWARGVLRAAPIRFLVRNMPVWFATWLARRYRTVSRAKQVRVSRQGARRLDCILDGVREQLERDPHDVVICGHIHHMAETPFEVNGR